MIDIAMYRNRIGCFRQKFKKNCAFKNIHHQKYEERKVSNKNTLKTIQSIFKLLLIICFIVCGPNPSCTAILNTFTQDNSNICNNQPTEILQTIASIGFTDLVTPCEKFQLEDKNFLARYTYGNKKQHGIKIVHWNKGSSYLENKKHEIEPIIQKYHPHIFGLSEANLFNHHDISKVQFPEYNLHTCPTLSNPQLKVSRVVVYIHTSLVVKPRPDLMNNKISAIWLEVGLPNTKKILVCNLYREWGYLRQQDKLSHSLSEQLERWKLFIEQWEKAISEDKEVIVTGDVNINSLKWMKDDLPSTDSTYKLRALTELLFEKIIPLGVSQQVSIATHS